VLERILAGGAGGDAAIVAVLSTPAAAQALDLGGRIGHRLTTRSAAEMAALTGFNFHRGVLALVRRAPMRDVSALVTAAVPRTIAGASGDRQAHAEHEAANAGHRRNAAVDDRPAVLVVAEHLVDVDNVGSCFRNARAFGAAGVLLDDRCPDPLYRKAVRTSLGAVLDVPWVQAPLGEIVHALGAAGVVTVGLAPLPAAAPVAEVAAELASHAAVALVVGNEGHGLSAETRARCTRLARIPMAPGADSLNVATALAVALYEWRGRQT
jgi:tRNA G18 (ribose-2'-O)-methylase SpoU